MRINLRIKAVVAAVTAATVFCVCIVPYGNVAAVSAQSYALINADTLEVLDSGNAHARLPMASTTKIMTALILAEQGTPEKQIVTTKEMVTVEGSSMGLLEGDTVSYYALLVGMMLSSGNDAANTAAIAVAGSVSDFADMMNKRAAEIGMTNTHFVTPSGLDSDEHYSTAYDMALLAAEALKNKTLREIMSSKKLTVEYGNPPYSRTLSNHNKLLGMYDDCIGVKTGFTKKSGRCLVSAAKRDGCTVIAVTLNAPDDWNDHIALFDYGLSRLTAEDITAELKDDTIPIVGGNADRVRITTGNFTVGCTANSRQGITSELNLVPFIYAPCTPGQVVGTVEYEYNGRTIHTESIYTVGDVEYKKKPHQNLIQKFNENIKKIIKRFI